MLRRSNLSIRIECQAADDRTVEGNAFGVPMTLSRVTRKAAHENLPIWMS
jgi:hypothetical protein